MSTSTQPPKPRRRWYQFSLLTRLIVMSMLVVGVAWLASIAREARRQRIVVTEFLELGATIKFSDEQPSRPEMFDTDYLGRIEEITLWLPDPDDETTWFANDFLRPQRFNAEIGDVSWIAACKNLKWLQLVRIGLSDVSWLAELRHLETLNLSENPISDVSSIRELRKLNWLVLDNTQVADLSPLVGLKNLRTLELRNTKVVDVSPLVELKKLETLDLANSPVSDVSALVDWKGNLKRLNLSGTQVRDISSLAKLNTLELLSLSNTQVADLSPLAELNSLWYLNLEDTKVSREDVEWLESKLPNCGIVVTLSSEEDASLPPDHQPADEDD